MKTVTIKIPFDIEVPEGQELVLSAPKGGDVFYNFHGNKMIAPDHVIYKDNFFVLKPIMNRIDWEKLKGFPCEFSFNNKDWVFSRFDSLLVNENNIYSNETGILWPYCRPNHNLIFGHDGGECPLPNGLIVNTNISCNESYPLIDSVNDIDWNDVKNFKIVGIDNGYCY